MNSRDLSIRSRSRPNTPYSPTNEEIRAECAQIRAGWNETEHQKRAGLPPGRDLLELFPVVWGVLDGRR